MNHVWPGGERWTGKVSVPTTLGSESKVRRLKVYAIVIYSPLRGEKRGKKRASRMATRGGGGGGRGGGCLWNVYQWPGRRRRCSVRGERGREEKKTVCDRVPAVVKKKKKLSGIRSTGCRSEGGMLRLVEIVEKKKKEKKRDKVGFTSGKGVRGQSAPEELESTVGMRLSSVATPKKKGTHAQELRGKEGDTTSTGHAKVTKRRHGATQQPSKKKKECAVRIYDR